MAEVVDCYSISEFYSAVAAIIQIKYNIFILYCCESLKHPPDPRREEDVRAEGRKLLTDGEKKSFQNFLLELSLREEMGPWLMGYFSSFVRTLSLNRIYRKNPSSSYANVKKNPSKTPLYPDKSRVLLWIVSNLKHLGALFKQLTFLYVHSSMSLFLRQCNKLKRIKVERQISMSISPSALHASSHFPEPTKPFIVLKLQKLWSTFVKYIQFCRILWLRNWETFDRVASSSRFSFSINFLLFTKNYLFFGAQKISLSSFLGAN